MKRNVHWVYSVSMQPNKDKDTQNSVLLHSICHFMNCSCLVQKWMLQFGCIWRWWCRQAHFGVQTWPEISLKMSHFKQWLHQVFSGRINPLCVLLQSRTEPYCWNPFTFLYLKQARQSINHHLNLQRIFKKCIYQAISEVRYMAATLCSQSLPNYTTFHNTVTWIQSLLWQPQIAGSQHLTSKIKLWYSITYLKVPVFLFPVRNTRWIRGLRTVIRGIRVWDAFNTKLCFTKQ